MTAKYIRISSWNDQDRTVTFVIGTKYYEYQLPDGYELIKRTVQGIAKLSQGKALQYVKARYPVIPDNQALHAQFQSEGKGAR